MSDPTLEQTELHVKLFLPEGQQLFTREEVGQYVGDVAAQAYRQGFAEAVATIGRGEPPRHMH